PGNSLAVFNRWRRPRRRVPPYREFLRISPLLYLRGGASLSRGGYGHCALALTDRRLGKRPSFPLKPLRSPALLRVWQGCPGQFSRGRQRLGAAVAAAITTVWEASSQA